LSYASGHIVSLLIINSYKTCGFSYKFVVRLCCREYAILSWSL